MFKVWFGFFFAGDVRRNDFKTVVVGLCSEECYEVGASALGYSIVNHNVVVRDGNLKSINNNLLISISR